MMCLCDEFVLCCAVLCEGVGAVGAFYICFNKLRLENSLYRQNNFHEHTFVRSFIIYVVRVCVVWNPFAMAVRATHVGIHAQNGISSNHSTLMHVLHLFKRI